MEWNQSAALSVAEDDMENFQGIMEDIDNIVTCDPQQVQELNGIISEAFPGMIDPGLADLISQIPCSDGSCGFGGGRKKAAGRKHSRKIQKGGSKTKYLAHLLAIGVILGGGYSGYIGWGVVEATLVAKGILPKLCHGITQWGLNLLFAQKGQYCSDIAQRYSMLSKAVAAMLAAGGGLILVGNNVYSMIQSQIEAALDKILVKSIQTAGTTKDKMMSIWNWLVAPPATDKTANEAAAIVNTLEIAVATGGSGATLPLEAGQRVGAALGQTAPINFVDPALAAPMQGHWATAFAALNQGGGRRHKRKRKSKKRKSKKHKSAKRKSYRRRRRSRR